MFKRQVRINTSADKVKELLTRGVEDVFVKENLEKRLLSGEKLRVKFGIDPTSPHIHLGHAVVLRKLKMLQDLGHQAVLIIGDFTATIGDPSGKSKARPPLSHEEIKRNLKGYLTQAGKIIDVKRAEVYYNSKWLGKLDGVEIMKLLSNISTNQILDRDDFSKRLAEHKSIRMYELLYPVMQAYDSVMVKADLELGGTDQLFNLMLGRDLMEKKSMRAQDILTVPIIEGLDGVEKMSKSLGNYVALIDEPNDMYGKIMSVRDDLITKYFLLCTDTPEFEIEKIKNEMASGANPKDFKMKLAREIVTLYHGEKFAISAESNFTSTFSQGGIPSDIETVSESKGKLISEIVLAKGIVSSKSEWGRLVGGSGVENADTGEKISDQFAKLEKDITLKIGKRRFIKIIAK